MKFSSIGYLLKEGARNFWSNRLMSFASIGVLISCMLLSGGSVLLSMNVGSVMNKIEQKNLIMVYLNDDIGALEAVKVGDRISQVPNVAESELVTKDQGLEELMQEVEDVDALLEELQLDNPLPHAYRVTLNDLTQYDATKRQLETLDGVQKVRGESDVPNKLVEMERTVNGTLYWIIALLIRVLSGRTPQEIVDSDLYFIDRIGLRENLSPTRANGLLAMIKQMKLYALAYQNKQ